MVTDRMVEEQEGEESKGSQRTKGGRFECELSSGTIDDGKQGQLEGGAPSLEASGSRRV